MVVVISKIFKVLFQLVIVNVSMPIHEIILILRFQAKTHLAELSAEMGKFSKIADLPVKIDDSMRNELRDIAADVTQLAELLQGVGIEKTEMTQEGKKGEIC